MPQELIAVIVKLSWPDLGEALTGWTSSQHIQIASSHLDQIKKLIGFDLAQIFRPERDTRPIAFERGRGRTIRVNEQSRLVTARLKAERKPAHSREEVNVSQRPAAQAASCSSKRNPVRSFSA